MKTLFKRSFSLFLAMIFLLSFFTSGVSAAAADNASGDSLYSKINTARAAVSKAELVRSDGLEKIAAIYAGALCEAGSDFRKATDFKTLPSGERVITLAAANNIAVMGFYYSVFFGNGNAIETTDEFTSRAVNGDYKRVGIACIEGADGSYATVIVYDQWSV